jgi:hypothetical protein
MKRPHRITAEPEIGDGQAHVAPPIAVGSQHPPPQLDCHTHNTGTDRQPHASSTKTTTERIHKMATYRTVLTATNLRLAPATDLPTVVAALRPLLAEFSALDLEAVPTFGEVANPDTNELLYVSNEGLLTFVLTCEGRGHGHLHSKAKQGIDQVERLLAAPGTVTLYNEEVTPYTEGAVMFRFLGADERMRSIAKVNNGFSMLKDMLQDSLTSDQIEQLRHQALTLLSSNPDVTPSRWARRPSAKRP